ncbi:hypothetical protein S83_067646 [Arachis hypogaea]
MSPNTFAISFGGRENGVKKTKDNKNIRVLDLIDECASESGEGLVFIIWVLLGLKETSFKFKIFSCKMLLLTC